MPNLHAFYAISYYKNRSIKSHLVLVTANKITIDLSNIKIMSLFNKVILIY